MPLSGAVPNQNERSASVVQSVKRESKRTCLATTTRPIEVAKITPASAPLLRGPRRRPAATRSPAVARAAIAEGSLAANAFSPKARIEAAASQ